MIDRHEAQRLIDRVSYHDMKFRVDDGNFMGSHEATVLRLILDHSVLDAATLKPGVVRTSFNVHYAQLRDEADFYAWVWRMVQQRVLHEAGEFFLIDGHRVHDPHLHEREANRL